MFVFINGRDEILFIFNLIFLLSRNEMAMGCGRAMHTHTHTQEPVFQEVSMAKNEMN